MKRIRYYLFVFSLLVSISFCYSQTNSSESYRFPGETNYKKGKVYLKDNTRFEVTKLTIINDHLTFVQKNTSKTSEYNLDDIQILKVSEGTYAGSYALYGGLLFGLSAALGVAQAEAEIANDPYKTRSDISAGAIIGGFTAAGVLIGGIAGSSKSKWKTLYVNEYASLNQRVRYAINFKANTNYYTNKNYYGVNFLLEF